MTVSDSVDVVEYDLTVSGYRAEYPNGDFGLVVYKNRPWLGYSLPTGDVRGVWRFYAAQDRDWMTVVETTNDGQSERHGPIHPIQVNAYPIESGPTPEPRRNVTILETYGEQTDPPVLPDPVALDVFEQPYTASFGIATRTNTSDHDLSNVEASGLVRGVEVEARGDYFLEVPINRSNLTVSVLDRTANATTVRVQLRDTATGEPIATTDREGSVVIDGQRYNTTENGTVTATLHQPVGGIAARYEPGWWWYGDPGYVADSDVTSVHGTELQVVRILYQLGVPIALFLVAVFIIDRFTGWHIWPPWRGLE